MAIDTSKQQRTLLQERATPLETFASPLLNSVFPASEIPVLAADTNSPLQAVAPAVGGGNRGGSGAGGGGGGGAGGGGGGGGGEESATNNLSFPVIWSEGIALVQPISVDAFSFTTPYDVNRDGTINDSDKIDGYYQFAQKVTGNVWQAGMYTAAPNQTINVNTIDWGDSLESRPLSVGKPVRIELTLYKDLTSEDSPVPSLTTFSMNVLANPSSPNEVQGAGATAYPINPGGITTVDDERLNATAGTQATVYSPDARLVVQQLVGDVPDGYLTWDGTKWTDPTPNDGIGVQDPVTGITFAGELNVAGKVIYGLSQGGWRPTSTGEYRITFYLPVNGNTQLDQAVINAGGEGETGYTTPVVLANETNTINLSYIDVQVVAGGSGGRRSLSELMPFEVGNNENFNALMAGGNPLVPQI